MHWQYKAKIMKICALLPAGAGLYKFIQKTFGRLKADQMSRIPAQIEMARWILLKAIINSIVKAEDFSIV